MIALCSLAGCAVGMVSRGFAWQSLYAEAAPAQTWEQYCEHKVAGWGGADDLFSELNMRLKTAGSQGWELVSGSAAGNSLVVCFKRPAVSVPK